MLVAPTSPRGRQSQCHHPLTGIIVVMLFKPLALQILFPASTGQRKGACLSLVAACGHPGWPLRPRGVLPFLLGLNCVREAVPVLFVGHVTQPLSSPPFNRRRSLPKVTVRIQQSPLSSYALQLPSTSMDSPLPLLRNCFCGYTLCF